MEHRLSDAATTEGNRAIAASPLWHADLQALAPKATWLRGQLPMLADPDTFAGTTRLHTGNRVDGERIDIG